MTPQNIAKKGILLNTILILATIAAFISIKITNYMAENPYGHSLDWQQIYNIQKSALVALAVISGIVLVLSLILFIKSKQKANGLIFLFVSAAIALILAVLNLVLGIITWILSGISISQLRKMAAESNFENKLNSTNTMYEYTSMNENNNFNNISDNNPENKDENAAEGKELENTNNE